MSVMVVLVDTNVVIDFLLGREPFYEAAAGIMDKCADKEITGYLAVHSVPNLWYILRKVPEEKRREWLRDILAEFLRHPHISRHLQMA